MRLIDADRLVVELGHLTPVNDSPYWIGRVDGINDTLSYISKQRTIDAEPIKRAKWYKDEDNFIRCSNCNVPATYGVVEYFPYITFEKIMSKYCPNCGAKMDLEE